MARADLEHAVGFVAGTDNDTTNLSLIAAARRINPALFIAARQNRPASAPLFAAMDVDSLLVPTEVVAHEVYAQLSTPLLWRFLQEMPARGDEWAADIIDRLRAALRPAAAAASGRSPLRRRGARHWAAGCARATPGSATSCAAPQDRRPATGRRSAAAGARHRERTRPDDDFVLAPDDQLLFAGQPSARPHLMDTMTNDAVSEYVLYRPSRALRLAVAKADATHSPDAMNVAASRQPRMSNSEWSGTVVGCIRPWRSTCASTTFEQLSRDTPDGQADASQAIGTDPVWAIPAGEQCWHTSASGIEGNQSHRGDAGMDRRQFISAAAVASAATAATTVLTEDSAHADPRLIRPYGPPEEVDERFLDVLTRVNDLQVPDTSSAYQQQIDTWPARGRWPRARCGWSARTSTRAARTITALRCSAR